jgi:hypothetical protein
MKEFHFRPWMVPPSVRLVVGTAGSWAQLMLEGTLRAALQKSCGAYSMPISQHCNCGSTLRKWLQKRPRLRQLFPHFSLKQARFRVIPMSRAMHYWGRRLKQNQPRLLLLCASQRCEGLAGIDRKRTVLTDVDGGSPCTRKSH